MMQPRRSSVGSWLALATGLLAGVSLLWFLGPLLAIGAWRPLERTAARVLVIALLLVLPLLAALWRHLHALRQARRAAQQPDDLDTVVDQALLRLRGRPTEEPGGWRAAWSRFGQAQPADPLLARPWVLVIGLPGADKRRALAAAGYELPLRSTAEPPCTWCITAQGVLIDVAEDLLTERSADWLRLLRRLREARPLQPLSTVLLMLPAAERGGQLLANLTAQTGLLRHRLTELMQITGMVPPLHLALTGCDRLQGFPNADLQQRLQVAASALGLVAVNSRPAALLGRDPDQLRQLIDTQLLAPAASPQFAWRYLRRQRWLVRGGYAATLLVVAGLAAGWAISRDKNLRLIAEQQTLLSTIQTALDAAHSGLAKDDLAPLLPALNRLRASARPAQPADWTATLGLHQGDRLSAAAQLAYTKLLEQSLLPHIAKRLEQRLRAASTDNLEYGYESLVTYLMLYNPEQYDASMLHASVAVDWDNNDARLAPEQRTELDAHLAAVLDLGPPRQVALPRDEALVTSVRELLAAYPLEFRVYSRIRRQYRPSELPDFTVAGAGGPNAAAVFQRASAEPLTKGISGLYTKAGHEQFLKRAVKATAQLAQQESWVLGQEPSASRLEDSTPGNTLTDKVLRLYYQDYIRTWDAFLSDIRLAAVPDRASAERVAALLVAADSPLTALLRNVALNLAPGQRLSELAGAGGAAPKQVDDHFAALRQVVSGQPPPLDAALLLLTQRLKQPDVALAALVEFKAEADRLPQPLRNMFLQLMPQTVDGGATAIPDASIATLAVATAEFNALQRLCERAATGRYPLVAQARAEMTPADFTALFGAGSGFDAYFQRWVLPLVDTSTRNWAWRRGTEARRPVPEAALASFHRAIDIRDAFFPGGTQQPQLKIQLLVQALDSSVSALELRIDDRLTLLKPGQGSTTIDWPGQPAMRRISLGAAGQKVPELSLEGPWSLQRLLDALTLQPSRTPERYLAKLHIGGRPAELNLASTSVRGLGTAQLRAFRCPAAADPASPAAPSKVGIGVRINNTNNTGEGVVKR